MHDTARVSSPEITAPPAPLPLATRIWAHTRSVGRFRGQARVGVALVRRQVQPGMVYTSARGFPLRVDPDDYFQACMLLGLYDPVGLALARRCIRPGSVAVDAGAHFGYFSLEFARLVGLGGEVHAFECDPRAAARLREHVRLSGGLPVSVNEAAVSDGSVPELTLRLPDQLGWSSIRREHWVEASSEVTVAAVSLDEALGAAGVDPRKVSFMKVDVEGAELLALRGAEGMLSAGSPAVLVEFEPERMRFLGDDPAELLGYLADLGYRPARPRLSALGHLHLGPARPEDAGDLLFERA